MARKIIGITGFAGAGKDTVAELLSLHNFWVNVESLAEPLRELVAIKYNLTQTHFSQELKNVPLPRWGGRTPRELLQYEGTEATRNSLALQNFLGIPVHDFWLRNLDERSNHQRIIVIPDVRFQDEYDWIMENNGVCIHLTRAAASATLGLSNHPSNNIPTPRNHGRDFHVTNDGTIKELEDKLIAINLPSLF